MDYSRDDFVIAIRSAFLKRENQQRFSLIGLLFFSLIFLILGSFNLKVVDYFKIGIKEIVYRAAFIVSGPENFIRGNYTNIQSHFKLYNENEKNMSELRVLRSQNLSTKIITLENIKYKKLIDDYFIKDNETFAKVLIDNKSPFLRSVIINKGSKNNIKLGMIVLDEGFLIGKIVEVNYLTSRVLLITDINSKIPVSLQPGDIQAIMTGKDVQSGTIQYFKDKDLKNNNKKFLVTSSGAGGVFKSGIPIGKIKATEEISSNNDKIVDFYNDFSQLKFVKVVSYSNTKGSIDKTSKNNLQEIENKIIKTNEQKENIRILVVEKKIAKEIRIKIEEENSFLKSKVFKIQNEIMELKNILDQNNFDKDNLIFLQLDQVYGKKCKKTFLNNLYKVGSEKYKTCVLNKGINE